MPESVAPVAARGFLAGRRSHLYRLEAPRPRTATARPATPSAPPLAAARYVRRGTLEMRNVLVSNAEYARFLNALSKSGLPNSHDGTYLLACEMPHEPGARLPARAELARLTHGAAITGNAAYRFGDVTPVTEPGRPASTVHHLLGNLQVWCGDGPADQVDSAGVAARWRHGDRMNTPATQQADERNNLTS